MAKKKQTINKVQNGMLADVVLSTNSNWFGANGNCFGAQLSQVDTLFRNNRWYMLSNMRQLLSEMYVEHGLIQTVCDVPVDDGLRGGVEIKTKQATPEQIQQVQGVMEKEGDLTVMGQTMKWNRLFGGAGVLTLTDQDPKTPLNVKAIRTDSPLMFRACDMWELFGDLQNIEGANYEGAGWQQQNFEFYSYYSKQVHVSRVKKLKGLEAPSFVRPRLRGWGFSIVEAMVRSINQYLKSTDLSFEVLDEFKVDVFKIKNLTNSLMSDEGCQAIQRRVALANQEKNYNNAITMDAEDDYIQKQITFSGLAEAQQGIRLQVASDLRMPLTKIFGDMPTGFAADENGIENYNSMVESQVRQKCKYDILFMVELRFQQQFGFVPTDLEISFAPLRVLSAEQEENCKEKKFNRVLAAKSAGEITSLEFRQMCNKDDLLPIQLETTESALNLAMDENQAKAELLNPAPKEE